MKVTSKRRVKEVRENFFPDEVRVTGSQLMERLSSELPHGDVPVPNLLIHEVFYQGPAVLLEAGDEHTDVQVGVCPRPDREVVSHGEDIDTVGEGSLSTYILLERGGGCSPTVDLSVEAGDNQESIGDAGYVGLED